MHFQLHFVLLDDVLADELAAFDPAFVDDDLVVFAQLDLVVLDCVIEWLVLWSACIYRCVPSLILWMICSRLIETEKICLPACSTSWYFFICSLFYFYICCSFLLLEAGHFITPYSLVSPCLPFFCAGCPVCINHPHTYINHLLLFSLSHPRTTPA